MKLSKSASDAVVGAFVVLGVVAITAATMWGREAHLGRGKAVVTARFRDVGNARVGTNAYIQGVRAGRISAMELGDDGWVRARVALEPNVRLPDDPAIVLGAASVVGEWQATFTSRAAAADDPEVRRQLADAAGEPHVLPGATMPDVKQFTLGAGRILDDIGALAGRARVAFDDDAARELHVAIENSRTLSTRLASASDALQRTARRVDSASADGNLQRAIEDATAAAADARATATELRSFTARGAEARIAVDRVIARMDTLLLLSTNGRGTIGRVVSDPALYNSTDSLVRDLRALVADFKANPKRYVNLRVF